MVANSETVKLFKYLNQFDDYTSNKDKSSSIILAHLSKKIHLQWGILHPSIFAHTITFSETKNWGYL